MQSCIYRGQVSHRRLRPVRNEFRYSVYMLYLDLAELDQVFEPFLFWSARRPAPAWFRRADHLGDSSVPLDRAVRDLVEKQTGARPTGAIRLLTQLRYFGYCFNPLSVYYCFDPGDRVESVVLEVSNMPWREMHPYVLHGGQTTQNGALKFEFAKTFHVSPFLPIDMRYRCLVRPPDGRLNLALENWRGDEKTFDAHLVFERQPITARTLAGALARDPFATARVTALIHWQALRLWTRRVPVYDHPGRGSRGGPMAA